MTSTLSSRLAAVAALVPEGSVAADVGAGHGRLAAFLAGTGRCRRVVAIDASPRELEACLPTPGVVVRWGDGLAELEPEDGVDTAIVAGLGGAAIAGIVARRPAGLALRLFVLQPQTEAALLRAGLPPAGLVLTGERLVEDGGRFYPILVAVPGGAAEVPASYPGLTPADVLEAGPYLLRDRPEELMRAWSSQRDRLAGIAARGAAARARVEGALARAERILAALAT
jgi:tRNA (adenine22-N1)-methyltransferase